jgi:PAS domain S-box-containing protein
MKSDSHQTGDAGELRRRAEERLNTQPGDQHGPPSEVELGRLFHELQVHQIELEMQNEELRDARVALEAALARSTDLYDFAPTGYFTLARNGAILAVNLTGARLVGIERDRLLNRRVASLVAEADGPILMAMLEKTFSGAAWQCCEVKLPREETTPLFVRIEAVLSVNRQECRASMLDVTERREIESQRNLLIKELQEAAARVKILSGLLPICCHCKKIRDDRGYWEQLESYISHHSEAMFSHGICPECMKMYYSDVSLRSSTDSNRDQHGR